MRRPTLLCVAVTGLQILWLDCYATAFVALSSPPPRRTHHNEHRKTVSLQTSMSENNVQAKSFSLSRDEIRPLFQFGKGDKEKLVNACGLWSLAVTAVTCPFWAAAMSLLNFIYKVTDDWDPHRAAFDATGKVWARSWLALSNSMPTFSGHVSQLREGNGPCLYVANHASWLDIPILCTVLDPVFKFIAKGELRGVPCIGQQLVGGHHILIDREDRRSQLRTFKDGISWLRKGVPLMAFPEGKRSKDGRLMDFKGGLFSMAAKTKVPIVPITISHAHAVMPCNALFPVQSGRGKLHVHVHEPIEATGRSEEELVGLVRQAFLSTLPYEQHPKASDEPERLAVKFVDAKDASIVAISAPNGRKLPAVDAHTDHIDLHHESQLHHLTSGDPSELPQVSSDSADHRGESFIELVEETRTTL